MDVLAFQSTCNLSHSSNSESGSNIFKLVHRNHFNIVFTNAQYVTINKYYTVFLCTISLKNHYIILAIGSSVLYHILKNDECYNE